MFTARPPQSVSALGHQWSRVVWRGLKTATKRSRLYHWDHVLAMANINETIGIHKTQSVFIAMK